MTMISDNMTQIRQSIQLAADKCERDSNKITLLAVSKTKPVTDIEEAIAAGQLQFGENYVQEGIDKIQYFQTHHSNTPLVWHFIGHLQSNKTRDVAEYFDWVHTVDRAKIATRLNDQRPANLPPLNVLIQVNISDETTKSGITLTEIDELAAHIANLPRLCLRGLMTIPRPAAENDVSLLRQDFSTMQHAFDKLKLKFASVDTLSMGMSHDFPLAIAAGSTLIRVGSAIFGARG